MYDSGRRVEGKLTLVLDTNMVSKGLDENGGKTDKKLGFDNCENLFPGDFDSSKCQPEFSGT